MDTAALVGHLVPAGSVYGFLAEHRREVFPDGLFADLFPSGRGRPSVPAEVIASVLVLQTLRDLSDSEAMDALRCDHLQPDPVRRTGQRRGLDHGQAVHRRLTPPPAYLPPRLVQDPHRVRRRNPQIDTHQPSLQPDGDAHSHQNNQWPASACLRATVYTSLNIWTGRRRRTTARSRRPQWYADRAAAG
jgi:hypothetical protein